MFKMHYNNWAISRRNDRSRKDFVFSAEESFAFYGSRQVGSDEESPGFTGQDAG